MLLVLVFYIPLSVSLSMSTADRTAGCIDSSADEQSVGLFSSGAAEPQRGTTTVCLRNHWQSVALRARQTLETDSLSLTHRQAGRHTCTRTGNSETSQSRPTHTETGRERQRHFQHDLAASTWWPKYLFLYLSALVHFRLMKTRWISVDRQAKYNCVVRNVAVKWRWRGELTLMYRCI